MICRDVLSEWFSVEFSPVLSSPVGKAASSYRAGANAFAAIPLNHARVKFRIRYFPGACFSPLSSGPKGSLSSEHCAVVQGCAHLCIVRYISAWCSAAQNACSEAVPCGLVCCSSTQYYSLSQRADAKRLPCYFRVEQCVAQRRGPFFSSVGSSKEQIRKEFSVIAILPHPLHSILSFCVLGSRRRIACCCF